MGVNNVVSRFQNRRMKNQQMKLTVFCMLVQIHVNGKVLENISGGHDQKWVWSVWWQDSKVDCI